MEVQRHLKSFVSARVRVGFWGKSFVVINLRNSGSWSTVRICGNLAIPLQNQVNGPCVSNQASGLPPQGSCEAQHKTVRWLKALRIFSVWFFLSVNYIAFVHELCRWQWLLPCKMLNTLELIVFTSFVSNSLVYLKILSWRKNAANDTKTEI